MTRRMDRMTDNPNPIYPPPLFKAELQEDIMTDERTNGRMNERNDRQPISYIAPPPFFKAGL